MSTYFSSFKTPSEAVNKLRTMFYIMVGVSIPIFLYIYLESKNNTFDASFPELKDTLQYIVPVLCAISSIGAYWSYEKRIRKARKLKDLKQKLVEVLKGSFYKFIPLEVTTLIAVLAYFLTGHIIFAGIYIGMLILFAMSNPTIHSVISDLRLPKSEVLLMREDVPFVEEESQVE